VDLRALAVILLATAPSTQAYSVLTHEAIIDTEWDKGIKPLLQARYPNSTADELKEAHSYAYAGAIIQDMGYYPFGSDFFSDLAHYVRTGDFIANLIRDAQNLDEYAFALGSLAHYAADTEGHSIAVNRAVPIEYPKLRREYGDLVTYEDNPSAHLRVEFGFDVLQVARGNYAPQAYHDFIGFRVAKPLLERAFLDTYGLKLKEVFTDIDLSLGTYRRSVSAVIPEMSRVAWELKKKDLQNARPGVTRRQFVFRLSRASYRKEWNSRYAQPGPGTRLLAFFVRIVPKIGPFKTLAFKAPTAATEKFFEDSFDRTIDRYRALLAEQGMHQLQLPNLDLDTGKPTRPAEYRMADDAYAKLAQKLAARDPASVNPALRQNILAFFADLNQPYHTKANRKDWQETVAAVEKLKSEGSASRVQQ
jgi:Zinc dependent phospholipase C